MAKNDYFVIVYRILTYLYECFQAGERADLDMISPEILKINNGYWINVIESMFEERYVSGVTKATMGIQIDNLKIKQTGIEYLQESSMMKKAKKEIVRDYNYIN